jgi:hypothetical protein
LDDEIEAMVLRVSTIQSAFKASETRWTTYFSIPVLIKENRPIDHCKVGIVKLMKSLSDRPNLPCGASSSIQGSALRGAAVSMRWRFIGLLIYLASLRGAFALTAIGR